MWVGASTPKSGAILHAHELQEAEAYRTTTKACDRSSAIRDKDEPGRNGDEPPSIINPMQVMGGGA